MFYSLKETKAHFTRWPFAHLVSIWAVGLSLLLIGVFLGVLANLDLGFKQISEKVGAVVFLQEGLSAGEVQQIKGKILKLPNVQELEFTSKQEALNELLSADPDLAKQIELVGKNPLPASFNIRLVDKSPEQVETLVNQLGKIPGIEEVKCSKKEAETLTNLIGSVKLFGLISGGFLGIIALLIIIYTIKLKVSLQSEDIKVMKLLGASKWFIRLPFLWGGVEEGFFGALLAIIILYIGYRGLNVKFAQIVFLPYQYLLPFIVSGVVLGLLGSLISIETYLKD